MNISDLKASKVAGINQHVFDELKKPQKKKGSTQLPGQMCQQAQWMWGQLVAWSLSSGIPVAKEHYFHPVRKWRFDFAVPDKMIAIEYEGLMSEKSGHTTLTGYTKDTEKYREASMLGWTILRYTVKNYKKFLTDVEQCVRNKQKNGCQDL